jgi:F0F1-type ATP synthase membrane subunit b/b'
MEDTQAFQILVVILSVTLAIFLVLAIIAATWLIKVLKNVNSITEKADKVAADIEAAADNFKQNTGPVAAVQTLLGLFKR